MAESSFIASAVLGRPTNSPDFFYTNAMYDGVYKALSTAIRERKGLSLLVGESGTGKSKLIHLLSSTIEEQVRVCHCTSQPSTFADLLATFDDPFVLPNRMSTVPVKLETIADRLRLWVYYKGTTVLVVDDAHLLDSAVLAQLTLLLDLNNPFSSLLQIILVGRPELEGKLARPELQQLRERVTMRCQLQALHPEEVRRFIFQRYPSPKGLRQYLFTGDAIERITYDSGAIPARISLLCDSALMSAYARGQKVVSLQTVEEITEKVLRSPEKRRSPKVSLSPLLPVLEPDLEQEQYLVSVKNRASIHSVRHSFLRFGRALIIIGLSAVLLLAGVTASKLIPIDQLTTALPIMVEKTRKMLSTLAQKVFIDPPPQQERDSHPVAQKSGKLVSLDRKER